MLTMKTALTSVFFCAAVALIAQENTLPNRFKANEAALQELSLKFNFKWKEITSRHHEFRINLY